MLYICPDWFLFMIYDQNQQHDDAKLDRFSNNTKL